MVMKKRLISFAVFAALTASAIAVPHQATVTANDSLRQMEYLDRGTVAVMTDGGVYLSWRLLGTENYDTSFDVYRDGELIDTVSDTTNMTDSGGGTGSRYTVVPSGEAVSSGKDVEVWNNEYLEIPLEPPQFGTSLDGEEYTYSPNDAAAADLDGDGEYEIILKWEPSNSFDSGKDAKHTGNVYVDAYKLNGVRLWRINMGININAGAHFTQIAAYDLDLDGYAEVVMKTAPGTKDGAGRYVSEASLIDSIKAIDNEADYRDTTAPNGEPTYGRVLDGPEFYTVFDGTTGDALDTVYYPNPRGTVVEWGDDWGNRSERYLTAVAYLDGERPSVIAWRGYYEKTTAAAFELVDKRLVRTADFNTDDEGNEKYTGQGNHNITVADVDGDGCDELISGSLCLDNDLSVLWCSGRGHGDALHLADYDPTHEGLEYFSVHESAPYGMTVYDAATGGELFHKDGDGDTGRGMMANFTGTGYYDIWGSGAYYSIGGDLFYPEEREPDSTNFRIFWSDSTYDELLDGTGSEGRSFKIDGKDGRIAVFDGTATNNSTKCNPCLQADILGDWREEVVVRSADDLSIRIYTTTIQTTHKLYTLMHDPAYRMQTVCQNAGYNQPPHIGYYINEENDRYDCRMYSSYVSTVHDGVTAVRTENLPSEMPKETPPPPTPLPTPAPESYYTIDENGVIQSYSGTTANVVIPDTINGITVTGIGNNVFMNNDTIRSVTMPDTVTSIGDMAFYDSSVGDVFLSSGLKTIGINAFSRCFDLAWINIPEGVTEICDGTFHLCESLRDVTLPEGITSIGSSAFYGCSVLKEIELPDGLTSIGSAAFRDTALKTIDIPEGVTSIGSSAFLNCGELESAALHDGIVSIGMRAFYGCGALEEIELPDGLTELGVSVFQDCVSLKRITVPEGITAVPDSFAAGCSSLESVSLPESLTSIGTYAFSRCEALRGITIMPGIISIGADAFSRTAPGFTISGYTNSAAHEYAQANDIIFYAIGEIEPTPTPVSTLPPMPTCAPDDEIQVVTNDASKITETSAVLNGSTTDPSAWSIGYYYLELPYGEVRATGGYAPSWSALASDLDPGTTYEYYAYDYIAGKRGEIKQFTTLGATPSPEPTATPSPEPSTSPTAPPAPTDTPPEPSAPPRCSVTTGAAVNIGKDTAVLTGELEIYDESVKDELYYEFWEDGTDEIKRVYGAGTAEHPYGGTIYGLKPGTVYCYYAYNGTVKGEIMTFKTLPDATPPDGYEYPYRIVSDSSSDSKRIFTVERYRETAAAVMICASYDLQGRLVRIETKALAGNEDEVFSAEFMASDKQRVFVWENINSIKPLSTVYEG